MSTTRLANCVRSFRMQRGWAQAELAERAGISRTAVSAIEGERLIPSVATALTLAEVFGVSVEALFGSSATPLSAVSWAWLPPRSPWRYWQAEVQGRWLAYPVERTGSVNAGHDGIAGMEGPAEPAGKRARETLVLATCDPAAGLLASEYQRVSGLRLIVLTRSSGDALDLLQAGLVHVAGLHYATVGLQQENERVVRERLGGGYALLRAMDWQEGIAVAGGASARTVRGLLRSNPRWVGREVGSAARACLDRLLPAQQNVRYIASDHWGVTTAIRSGWADAGVCVQLVCEDAGLQFLSVQLESCDLCFSESLAGDRRIQALVALLRSAAYRRLISELPGYDTRDMGTLHHCSAINPAG
ncbi:MAG: substrate-binding domain-containing protein [Pirellulaceae bacterium]